MYQNNFLSDWKNRKKEIEYFSRKMVAKDGLEFWATIRMAKNSLTKLYLCGLTKDVAWVPIWTPCF